MQQAVFERSQLNGLAALAVTVMATVSIWMPLSISMDASAVCGACGTAEASSVRRKRGPYARDDLAHVERLCDVVVRAALESLELILDEVFGGEHDYRYLTRAE
jgi:hypothetical protein